MAGFEGFSITIGRVGYTNIPPQNSIEGISLTLGGNKTYLETTIGFKGFSIQRENLKSVKVIRRHKND